MEYKEEDYLQLSGIQHFAFCRRQWALIHIEKLWAENLLTTQGTIMHERAHDNVQSEKRGDLITVRGLPIASRELGFSGQCDVVEFREHADGITLHGKKGRYLPYPVEYKRGSPKNDDCDKLQLCAQAICLEEMLQCVISEGALYYGATKHRQAVTFSDEMRKRVTEFANEMHGMFERRYTPKVKPGSFCKQCSLNNQCLPELMRKKSVAAYLRKGLNEEAED